MFRGMNHLHLNSMPQSLRSGYGDTTHRTILTTTLLGPESYEVAGAAFTEPSMPCGGGGGGVLCPLTYYACNFLQLKGVVEAAIASHNVDISK